MNTVIYPMNNYPTSLLGEEYIDEHYEPKSFIRMARETVTHYSVEDCDLTSLLAVVIGSKAKPEVCGRLAAIGVHQLARMSVQELNNIPGVTSDAAASLVGAFGLAKKLATQREYQPALRTPQDVASLLMDEMRHLTQEHFTCLYVDSKNRLIRKQTLFIGTLDYCAVHPREIFKEAVRISACSVVCAHNHPSGDPDPSREDIMLTKTIARAGEMIDIPLLDHVIIGDGKFISMKEQGFIS